MGKDKSNSLTLKDIGRGLICRCPHCGRGHLFGKFLKINDYCSHCGEALYHQRADDFPAYAVIAIVGHIVVPAELFAEVHYALPDWTLYGVWMPLTVILSLALLQPVKGLIVNIQWRLGLHGFAQRLFPS